MTGIILAAVLGWFVGYLMGWRVHGNSVVEQIELQGTFLHKGRVYRAVEQEPAPYKVEPPPSHP